jgi:hypothetical protein
MIIGTTFSEATMRPNPRHALVFKAHCDLASCHTALGEHAAVRLPPPLAAAVVGRAANLMGTESVAPLWKELVAAAL